MEQKICSDLPRVASSNGVLSSLLLLVARTGRHQQRYEYGYRLVAGCVPFRYRSSSSIKNDVHHSIEVMMVTTQGGPGLLFPKGGWETDETAEEAACREAFEEAGVRGDLKGCIGSWDFKSKRQQGHSSPEGLCRAYMFALVVKEELDFWPEQRSRKRHWFTAVEAMEKCRYEWMQRVLEQCILHLSSGQHDRLLPATRDWDRKDCCNLGLCHTRAAKKDVDCLHLAGSWTLSSAKDGCGQGLWCDMHEGSSLILNCHHL